MKVPSVVVDEEVDDLEVDVDAEAVPTVISESSAEVVVDHPTEADSLVVPHPTAVVVDSVDLPLLLLTVVLPPMVVDPQLVAMAVEAMATHLAAVVAFELPLPADASLLALLTPQRRVNGAGSVSVPPPTCWCWRTAAPRARRRS